MAWVNFTNVLGAAFVPIFFREKLQSQTVEVEESFEKHFCTQKGCLQNVGEIDPKAAVVDVCYCYYGSVLLR